MLLLAALAPGPALADDAAPLSFAYTGEYARGRGGDAYADQYLLSATSGSDVLGWRGGTFVVEVTHRSGEALEQVLGLPLLQQVQAVYGAGNVTRLTQLSYRHDFREVPMSVTVGRIYPNADFFAFSCHYQHMTFCGGPPGNITNGWFTDPVSQYGAVLVADVAPHVKLKVGAYDVNPQNISSSQGLRLQTSGSSTGTLVAVELEAASERSRWQVGAWHDSSEYAGVEAPMGASSALHEHETGGYLGIEYIIAQPAGRTLRGFANIVRADADTNRVDRLEAIGLWMDAPFSGRENDRIAVAIGRTRVNRKLRGGTVGTEYPIELNYSVAVAPWLTLMPNLQHIRQSGQRRSSLNVAGLRVELAF